MSWFSKLLGMTNNEVANNRNLGSESLIADNVDVLEGLFVDNNPPVQTHEASTENGSTLRAYLEQDFARKGFDDGYNGHSSELLENKILSIKADFRFNLNLKIDTARQEVLKLENHKINVEGMSDKLVRQLENYINSVKYNITELEAEISLSAINEGMVMIGIHQYRDGFIRGTEAYQDEKIIAGSTSLFK
jgi:hypothetical protein